jgi:hypothetical protein
VLLINKYSRGIDSRGIARTMGKDGLYRYKAWLKL